MAISLVTGGIIFGAIYIILYLISITFFNNKKGKNPFILPQLLSKPTVDGIVFDQSVRDGVLKQNFTEKRIPEKIDAIVIGSGIGGLSVAGLLAKAKKRVLVLEQHDVAGGCCHTYIDKKYEFDVGIHYIGEMNEGSMLHTLSDQLTDGKLMWAPIDEYFDVVSLGYDPPMQFPVSSKRAQFIADLIKKYPQEEAGINKFFGILRSLKGSSLRYYALKFLPLKLSLFLIKTGLVNWTSPWFKYVKMTLQEVMDDCFTNEEVKAIVSYCFGDYGTIPSEAPVTIQASLLNHFQSNGGFYPVGGASEIAFNMIPVIERAGGKVLVKARVSEIICDDEGKVIGVKVARSEGDYSIFAPKIISDAGIINTASLLPTLVVEKSNIPRVLSKTKSGVGCLSCFIGLKVPQGAHTLGLKKRNYWAFTDPNIDKITKEFVALNAEEAAGTELPLLFISFPSLKDPVWDKRFGNERLTCAIITLANWDWFNQWEDGRVKHRGNDYESLKKAFGQQMWRQAKALIPEVEDLEVEYFDVGTPITNKFYINSPKGEIYGLDHDLKRFSPEVCAYLRPDIGVPNLLLTGQDIVSCGFAGALFGGLICASHYLNRNLLTDLMAIKSKRAKSFIRTVPDETKKIN